MFPSFFSARVAQRLTIWGAAVGILVGIYAVAEVIHAQQTAAVAHERLRVTEALRAKVTDELGADATARPSPGTIGAIVAGINSLKDLNDRAAAQWSSHSRNRILLLVLILFVVGEMLVIEYRLLIKPIMRMVRVLQTGEGAIGRLDRYERRNDEIGAFAKALVSHFNLVRVQRNLAEAEQSNLSERLSAQEQFRQDSISFQDRIAEIVRNLESHAGRMATASENLATVSSAADERASASAQTTVRVSGSVNGVATAIQNMAATLAAAADGAEKTSAVAAAARSAVDAAKDDSKALSEAARTIEQVIALIEDVAGQTNLLALNATIEAARAGEMGRGFGVVAQEVKHLATRTARATEDVRSGLEGITAASQRIAERVSKLVESTEQVAAVAADISRALREQDAHSRSITETTTQSAEDIREVADTVKDVAGMISEAKRAAELVTKVSTDLGRQAADLRGAVNRFVETTERIAA